MTSPRLFQQLIATHIIERRDYPAILSPGKKSISFHELDELIFNISLTLTQMGFERGDRIAMVLPNGPEMAVAFLAVSSVCTCAPLNPAYLEDDFEFYLHDLKINALITSFRSDHPSRKAANKLGIPFIELIPDESVAGRLEFASQIPIDQTKTTPILADVDDIAMVLHTSGTTARPKIVPLTHRNLFHSVQNIISTYALSPEDRCLNMMPLFHIHGLLAAVAASLVSGGSVICSPGFISSQVVEWFREYQPTWYTAVPTIHHAVLEEMNKIFIDQRPALRFIRSCSSPLAPNLAKDLEHVFGVPVLEAYGMTEAAHQIASNPLPPMPHKFGSVGKATGTTRVAILDKLGKEVAANIVGEVCIRGENVITGYETDPGTNQANFLKGWLRTGDLGYLDNEGYLFLQGRCKELINRGGEKISPREIEEVLLQHSAVSQAVVFAVPHPNLGEDIAAAVVLKPGQDISSQDIRRFAVNKLVDFKIPRIILFLPDLPKGPTGKVQRIGLAKKLSSELDSQKHATSLASATPHTHTEMALVMIWQDALGIKPIGMQDDFLALGGDSLMAARILIQVENTFKVNLSLKDIFNVPTVQSMVNLIESRLEQNSNKHGH